MDPFSTALVAIGLFGWVLYRQFVQRPVTSRDLLLPIIGGAYLADRSAHSLEGAV